MTPLVILSRRPHQHDAEMLAGSTGIPVARSVPVGGVGIAFGPRGMELLTHRDKVGQGVGLDVEWIRRELSGGAHALRSDPLVRAVGGPGPLPEGWGPNGLPLVPRPLGSPTHFHPEPGIPDAEVNAIIAARPLIVDATAGFCNDAFHLAAVGYRVLAFERNGAISTVTWFNATSLLKDPLVGWAARSVTMRDGDSRRELLRLSEAPDVVVLDPMFPPKRRRSALPPKPIQVLRLLAGDDEDAAELLAVARKVATRRVVVKRSDDAPPLGDLWPDWSVQGKTVRYDVYAAPGARAEASPSEVGETDDGTPARGPGSKGPTA